MRTKLHAAIAAIALVTATPQLAHAQSLGDRFWGGPGEVPTGKALTVGVLGVGGLGLLTTAGIVWLGSRGKLSDAESLESSNGGRLTLCTNPGSASACQEAIGLRRDADRQTMTAGYLYAGGLVAILAATFTAQIWPNRPEPLRHAWIAPAPAQGGGGTFEFGTRF
jgi:hypothetical protein